LDGLEAVELKLSEVSKELNGRIDSEYYKKIFVKNQNQINKLNTIKLKMLSNDIKKGIFDLPPSNYLNKGVPLIRTSEIKNPRINFNTTVFISEKINKTNIKTCLSENDLVFTKIGAYIGDVALLPSTYKKYNISQNVAGVNLKNKADGYYLLAYFLSKIGKMQIERTIMLSGQGKLDLTDIRNYSIPTFSNTVQTKLKELIESSHQKLEESKSLYKQSEELLLKELDLLDFEPSKEKIAIKTFSESFADSGRLDSEYYQPKYDEIIKKIKSYKGGYVQLMDIAITKRGSLISNNYYSSKGRPYIRGADISSNTLIDNKLTYIDDAFKNTSETIVYEDDILFALIGSVGTASLVTRKFDNAFLSNNLGLIRLKKRTVKSIVLHLILISQKIGSMYFKQKEMRTAQPKISDKDTNDFIIPIIDNTIQTQIEEKIKQSFKLKEQSKQLLELAKQAVEVAIEQDETQAIKLINEQI
jgi:restriction endonuclease S subunit